MTSEMIKEKMMELDCDTEQAIECLIDEGQFYEDMEKNDL
tara:strand:+ start:361 stop:480 length:120 start_codon:yes stop_codon:yes gene_type:complete